jgi:hypothetical protein
MNIQVHIVFTPLHTVYRHVPESFLKKREAQLAAKAAEAEARKVAQAVSVKWFCGI